MCRESVREFFVVPKTKKATKLLSLVAFYGSGGRDRTYDQLINSQATIFIRLVHGAAVRK